MQYHNCFNHEQHLTLIMYQSTFSNMPKYSDLVGEIWHNGCVMLNLNLLMKTVKDRIMTNQDICCSFTRHLLPTCGRCKGQLVQFLWPLTGDGSPRAEKHRRQFWQKATSDTQLNCRWQNLLDEQKNVVYFLIARLLSKILFWFCNMGDTVCP